MNIRDMMVEGIERFKEKLKQHEDRSRRLEDRNKQLTARRNEYHDKKREFSARDFESECNKFCKNRLHEGRNSYSDKLDELKEIEQEIIEEERAQRQALEKKHLRKNDNLDRLKRRSGQIQENIKKINIADYDERVKQLSKEFGALIRHECEEMESELESIRNEKKQIEVEYSAVILEKEQLEIERKNFPELQDNPVEQALRHDPIDAAPTFLTQHTHQKRTNQVKQSGVSLNDIKRFLSDLENIHKLNDGLERKFVNIEHSLRNAKGNHIELELDGEENKKIRVHLKEKKDSAGVDVTTYSLDKGTRDDLSSIKSICRLAIFSAEARNQPGEFTVNESNPHKEEIKEYLRTAIKDVASRNPDLASQLTINGASFEATQRKSTRFGR